MRQLFKESKVQNTETNVPSRKYRSSSESIGYKFIFKGDLDDCNYVGVRCNGDYIV